MTKLIGLTGPAGSGKDTVAHMLRESRNFHQIAMADPIRLGICTMFNIPMECLTEPDQKNRTMEALGNKTPLETIQTLGEAGRANIHPDIWIKTAQRKIDYIQQSIAIKALPDSGIVIIDIWKPNEAKWLRDQGGTIWHIRRPNNPFESETTHPREMPIIQHAGEPYIINDGGIAQLQAAVDEQFNKQEATA